MEPVPEQSSEQQVCTCCPNPRTTLQFYVNHIKKNARPADDDTTCIICRNPYGMLDLATGLRDEPCQVSNIPSCSHVFGLVCMKRYIQEGHGNGCPLCRTEWFRRQATRHNDSDSVRHTFALSIAKLAGADYESTRFFLCREPQYAALALPMAGQWLERFSAIHSAIHKTFQTAEVQAYLVDLQNHCPEWVDERLVNPYTGRLDSYNVDPFTFRNWHQLPGLIEIVVHSALATPKAAQLAKVLFEQQDVNIQAPIPEQKTKIEVMSAVETIWFYGRYSEPEEADFVQLMLYVLWGGANLFRIIM